MGIVIGIAIANVAYLIHRFLPTTPGIDTALTLITPYLMCLTAEHFHYSGMLSVISGRPFLLKREELNKMPKSKLFADHLIKANERELDLEEARTGKE